MRLYGILRVVNRSVKNQLSVGKIMALRLVTQKPPTFFIEMKNQFEKLLLIERKNKINTNIYDHMEGYDAVLNLACASQYETKLEKKINFASALLWLLESSDYFTQLSQTTRPKDVLQLKSLLFRLMIKVMAFNFIKIWNN